MSAANIRDICIVFAPVYATFLIGGGQGLTQGSH